MADSLLLLVPVLQLHDLIRSHSRRRTLWRRGARSSSSLSELGARWVSSRGEEEDRKWATSVMKEIALTHLLLIIELLKKISHILYDKVFLGINRESHLKRRGEDKTRTTPSSFLRACFQSCRVENGRPIGQTSPIGGKPRTGLGRKPKLLTYPY